MKKILFSVALVLFAALLFASCSSDPGASVPENTEELAKLPEDFPLGQCPLYSCAEIVSIRNRDAGYISYDVEFNSFGTFEDVVEYYRKRFPNAVVKDFGIAYTILSVPENVSNTTEKQYICNFSIYSDVTKGTDGVCTVIVSVSEY